MSCPEFDIWGPIPAGSRFCAKATGTNADYLANVRVATTTTIVANWGTTALLNEPCVALASTGHGVIAEVRVDDEAPTVTLDLAVVGPNDEVLFSSRCQFSQASTKFVVHRVLVSA